MSDTIIYWLWGLVKTIPDDMYIIFICYIY